MQMKMKAEEVMTTTSMNKKMVNNDKNISTVVNVLLSLYCWKSSMIGFRSFFNRRSRLSQFESIESIS
jgi:hypothetical protein